MQRLQWTPELSGRFWDDLAGSQFLEKMSFANLSGYYLLEFIRPYLQPKGSHLDFGAGDGFLVGILLREGFATAAFEPSARAAHLTDDFGQHPFYLGTLGRDSAGQFDVVILSEVIEHLFDEDIPLVLNAIHRFLRPGGTLIVTTPNNENREASSVYCPTCRHIFHPWQHVRSFTADTLTAVLGDFGFERQVVHQMDFRDHVAASWEEQEAAAARAFQKTAERALREAPQDLAALLTKALQDQADNRRQFEEGRSKFDLTHGARDRLVYVGKKGKLSQPASSPIADSFTPPTESVQELANAHQTLLQAFGDFSQARKEFWQDHGRQIDTIVSLKGPFFVNTEELRERLELKRSKVQHAAVRAEAACGDFLQRLKSTAVSKHQHLLPMYLAALKTCPPVEPNTEEEELTRLGQKLIVRKLRKHPPIARFCAEVDNQDRAQWRRCGAAFAQHVELLRDLLQLPPCEKSDVFHSYGLLNKMNKYKSGLIFRIGRKLGIGRLARKLGLLPKV